MKKFIALVLALTLALSLAVTASAETTTVTNTGDNTQSVTGNYVAGSTTTTVYSIDIAWGDMSFTYTAGNEGSWDPDTLSYTGTTGGQWSEAKTITVTNKSNADITVTAAYASAAGYEDAKVVFGAESVTIGSADNTEGEDGAAMALTGTITVTPSGTLPEGTENATIGTITLTIS